MLFSDWGCLSLVLHVVRFIVSGLRKITHCMPFLTPNAPPGCQQVRWLTLGTRMNRLPPPIASVSGRKSLVVFVFEFKYVLPYLRLVN